MSRIPTKDDRLGVQAVAGTDNPDRLLDVVFIHGLAGDAWTTWMSNPDDDSTFWPDWLAEEFPNLGIWTVGYPAAVIGFGKPGMIIPMRAGNLSHQLVNAGLGVRPLVFVTHSMGGLIVKALIVKSQTLPDKDRKRLVSYVGGIVFCATPHRGSALAHAAAVLGKYSSGVLGTPFGAQAYVKEMRADAGPLDILHDEFIEWHRHNPIPIDSYAENIPLSRRRWLPKLLRLGRVVPRASANPDIGNIYDVDEDHLTLVKPRNRQHDVYAGVKRFIENALKQPSQPAASVAAAALTQVVGTVATPSRASISTQHDLSRIQRYTPVELIGREDRLAGLDEAWDKVRQAKTPRSHVLTYVALGGEGKTALIAKWAAQLAGQGWLGCDAAFAWSFYSQGTRDKGDASADVFLAKALRFFGDSGMADSAASAWDKGRRLAQLVGERRTLLILDGLEPLQYAPTSPTRGELKEAGIVAVLSGLAENNAGLCIVTTRYSIPDLNSFRKTTAPEIELKRLSTEAGVHLLKTLGVREESGTQEEFEKLVEDVKGHALTLNLLGRYLADAHAGDIRKRDLVKLAEADAEEQGGHAFRVMDAYVAWFEREGERGRQAIALLRLMGLFDRAASADCIAALAESPVIEKLTDPLVDLNETQQNLALTRLEEARLITVDRDEAGTLLALDCHPLIREYFARRLQAEQPHAWRAGHKRVYEHLCKTTTERDEPTLEQLQPLYQAVTHGCLAGLQQKACDDVYVARILKGTGQGGDYSARKLGAFGADLGAVACFFDEPWERVSIVISDPAWLLNEAATRLRALGRLREAVEPMRAALKAYVVDEEWKYAAITTANLSELALTLGDVSQAVRAAQESVEYADRSGDVGQRVTMRSTLAAGLHQKGRVDDAQTRFADAERMQAEWQPEYPRLYSLRGFGYCDLLLGSWERLTWQARFPNLTATDAADPLTTLDNIEKRVTQTQQWAIENRAGLLSIALDHLTLARVALYGSRLEQTPLPDPHDPESHIARAVTSLRKARQQDYLPPCLLTLAWYYHDHGDEAGARAALDEAEAIALRGPMPLHLADIHLHRARLFADRTELDKARALIQEHGYNRRLPELHDAEAALSAG
ncbi:MAG: hypothetical protein V3T53_01805 [Phycisphaerales bacterium]